MRTLPILALAPMAALALAAAPAPIDPQRIKADVRTLSSDAFAGRGPGEAGEAKTVDFLIGAFKAAGLQPGGEKGGWTQDVPLVRLDRLPGARLAIRAGDDSRVLELGRQATLSLTQPGRLALTDAPLVFGGWGIVDPARGWNAYDGVDLSGKVVVLLANDPDFEAGRDLGFGGRALTVAGRTGTKVAAAAKAGAAGVIIIHEEAGFSWPFSQAGRNDTLPSFAYAPLQPSPLGFSAIVEQQAATDLLRPLGLDLARLKARARDSRFRAFPLAATVSVTGENKATNVVSHNVIARLPGASRPDEYVMYGAHWDANGHTGAAEGGDAIRNGAVDNATGTAELLEVARAFAAGPRPARALLFAAWTAEEKGLLGAEYYASHPLYPLARTAAVINLDPHVVLPAARNLELIGPGQTDLEDDLRQVAAEAGQRIDPEPNPAAGWYFRSDHYPFARRGVPALAFRAGRDLVEGGTAAGDPVVAAYNRDCYHQPCDQFDPRWTFAGTAQEASAAYRVGLRIANAARWPGWRPGSEYRHVREETAAERR